MEILANASLGALARLIANKHFINQREFLESRPSPLHHQRQSPCCRFMWNAGEMAADSATHIPYRH